ncbi:MAG: leucine-rich repeat domain-containing protein, partial [Treponema porcinum]|uniref:leucine-rich repeat domain-containing protein n=1 Tax=Treponema porcinum TaxID=261392 RepID=UPI002A80B82A
MEEIVKKYGLLYSADLKCVLGIDSASDEFTGIVPNGAERIEEEAFSCCSVKNISLPDSVVSAGANLFCNSTELESVKLPKNLRTLPPNMFCGCKSLKKIEMPYEIDNLSEGLFAECT